MDFERSNVRLAIEFSDKAFATLIELKQFGVAAGIDRRGASDQSDGQRGSAVVGQERIAHTVDFEDVRQCRWISAVECGRDVVGRRGSETREGSGIALITVAKEAVVCCDCAIGVKDFIC